MNTVPEIFDSLGGPRKVADLLGIRPGTVSEMKRRKSIPVRYWPKLVDASNRVGVPGINYATLVQLHAERAA